MHNMADMNNRKQSCICFAILLIVLLYGCEYTGDGEFKAEGVWPFRNYILQLPDFELKKDLQKKYFLKGYRLNGVSYLELNVESSTPIPFHKLNLEIAIKIVDNKDNVIFFRKADLNAHYVRMSQQKKSSWSLESEWFTHYKFGDPDYDSRAVAYKHGAEPISTKTRTYWQKIVTEEAEYVIIVNIGNCIAVYGSLIANISLSSGWK